MGPDLREEGSTPVKEWLWCHLHGGEQMNDGAYRKAGEVELGERKPGPDLTGSVYREKLHRLMMRRLEELVSKKKAVVHRAPNGSPWWRNGTLYFRHDFVVYQGKVGEKAVRALPPARAEELLTFIDSIPSSSVEEGEASSVEEGEAWSLLRKLGEL